jgi:predicted transposase YbfD/YdcC
VGQIAVNEKSNEIPAVGDLLASFAPEFVTGAVVTADAMHTQTDTAQAILNAGADYVFKVKRNQPSLYRHQAGLPWEAVESRRLASAAAFLRRVNSLTHASRNPLSAAERPAWPRSPAVR